MQIRRIALRTADGLNPTPMSFSWVRDGVLMCAMDNEIAVYSQWREDNKMTKGPRNSQAPAITADKDIVDHRNLKEADILSLVTVSSSTRNPDNSNAYKLSSGIPQHEEQRILL